jgi:ferredoxin--NADP+ reductase
VALIGAGNVMLDLAHWLIRHVKVNEVIAVVRRGPAEVKFTKKEMESVAANLDIKALNEEIDRVKPVLQAIGQDVEGAKNFILSAIPKAEEKVSDSRFRFDFLASPSRIRGDENGSVRGLEVEDTLLTLDDGGNTVARRTGTTHMIECDTVIFCIGDRVDETFGLPVRRNEFVKNPNPRFPVNGLSFEAYDPNLDRPMDRIFVAGWSREASHGLVGIARKDGELGAKAILQYLETQPQLHNVDEVVEGVRKHLARLGKPVINLEMIKKLIEFERCEAQRQGAEDYKCASNADMLKEMGLH